MTFHDDVPTAGEASGPQPVARTEPSYPPDAPRTTRSAHNPPQTEPLLRRAADLIESARPMPLSSSVMINKDEVLELIDEAVAQLPEELRAARWLLKEREEFLDKVRREGDEILDAARAKAERMVQRTEVVKQAEARARRIVDGAEAESRRMRHECEDFCDQKLASFEIVLDRTMKLVAAGREKLAGPPLSPAEDEPNGADREGAPFNQDDLS
ncbi:MAG TPA: ATP synthase F0 subunit B [Acidimicrobiales bacterium]|jgi:hypothetical protein|nr:ATP synthase F0 subunit B [Acidimicrobiales bacterium]